MKRTLFVVLCLLITATIFAEKVKVIPIIITTNKSSTNQQIATSTPVIVHELLNHEIATPSWAIATPTTQVDNNGGNQ